VQTSSNIVVLLFRSTNEVKWQIGIWEDPSANDSTGYEVHTVEITSFSDTEQIISKLLLSEDENSFYFVTHDASN
jgi:hypothetical protein